MSKHPRPKTRRTRLSPQFIKRLSSWLVLSTALTLAVRSATRYWDADTVATGNVAATGVNLGGTGNWNTTTNAWWDGVAGSDVAWNNSNLDDAFFRGTAGTVTATTPIIA